MNLAIYALSNMVITMYEKEIQQMKAAADQQNWKAFQEALQLLVCEIKHEAALRLLLSYTQIFMDDFLRIYSQYKVETDGLQTADHEQFFVKYLRDVIEILEQHKGEPGVNNCRRAISKLQSLFLLNDCNEIYIETFEKSTINILIAISDQIWGRAYPDLHNRWLHATSNEDFLILAQHKARNSEHLQKTKLLLHQFTNDMDVLLQSGKQ